MEPRQLVQPSTGELGRSGERAAEDHDPAECERAGGELRRYRAILAASAYTEVLIAASSVEEARALAEAAKYELPYELVEHAVEDVFEDEGVEGEARPSPSEDGPQMAFEFVREGA